MMKKQLVRLVVAVCLSFVSVAALADPFNGIAAVVNKSVITQDDLNNQVAMVKERLQQHHVQLPSEMVLKQQVLQQLIDRELQLQQAERAGIKVSPTQVDTAIKRIAEQNHLSVAQLYQSSEQDGYTKKSFRAEVSKEILMQLIQNHEVAARISISKQEVEDYLSILAHSHRQLTEYHLGDILLALPESPSPAQVAKAEKKAQTVVAQLKHGANFEKLAVANSSGEEALKGGDLGWRKLAELPTPFVKDAESMKVGQVAGPIRTPNGFHVIKLLGMRHAGLKGTRAEQEKQVEQMIFERQFNQQLLNWIAQLRAQAYIKTY